MKATTHHSDVGRRFDHRGEPWQVAVPAISTDLEKGLRYHLAVRYGAECPAPVHVVPERIPGEELERLRRVWK